MKLFNLSFGKKQSAVDESEISSAKKAFKARQEVLDAFVYDEKSIEERTREVFPRTVFDNNVEVIRHDAKGNKSISSCVAFDESSFDKTNAPKTKRGMFATSPQTGDVINETVWAHYGHETYIGWNACAILAQNPIIHLACHIPAEDAISNGYDFVFADHPEADSNKDKLPSKDLLTALKKKTQLMGIDEVCINFAYKKRVFGTGIAIPVIYKNGKPYDMSNPFNTDGLKDCDYRGFKVVDPYWLVPQFEEESLRDPMNQRFMQPTWYKMPDGRQVHWTWFVKKDNAEVADILKPTYYYGGMPLTQMIYKRVWCADKTANEAPQLAMSKRMLVVDANVQNIIKEKSYVYQLMSVISKCRNNWGVFFKSPNSNIEQIDTSLTDFDETVFSQYQLVASLAQMPASKLLQTPPKGFNTTGEFEWKTYAQLLLTIQNIDYTPLIEKHLSILLAIQGKHHVINVRFNPIDTPSEKQKAEIELAKSDARVNYLQSGILNGEEIREVLRNDLNGEFSSIVSKNIDEGKKPIVSKNKERQISRVVRKIDKK